MQGIFTISLDFELHWGGFEKWALPVSYPFNSKERGQHLKYFPVDKTTYTNYFLNTRAVIPEMLDIFRKHDVHVTWTTVGMLFHKDKSSLESHFPEIKPTYAEQKLSAYQYIETQGIGPDEQSDPFHFAASLIKQIVETPHQELGTHTFAHYYCNEAGQTAEQFRADLKAAQRSAGLFGKTLRSLVFPRNQFNDQYLKVCFEEGITSVRSNPLDWFWHIESTQSESLWKRLNRGLDAYFPIGKENTFSLEKLQKREGFPVCIPASRLLRPYNPNEYLLNSFKLTRIKYEMTRAARLGQVYHLWWHPHNFGHYPEESLNALQEIMQCYSDLKKRYGMISLNMGEITGRVR